MVITGTTALIASLIAAGAIGGGAATWGGITTDQNTLGATELKDIRNRLNSGGVHDNTDYGSIAAKLNASAYWRSLSKTEQDNLIREYFINGVADKDDAIAWDTMLRDLGEYDSVGIAPDYLTEVQSYDQHLANAQKAIDDENQRLLDSLNEDLTSTSDAYINARNTLLAGQHQRNQMTVDTMASEMSRARRNAIEAGASAGIRIAGNVNTMLSAQNKMSQQSLETSNQLAQMLVNQRNAEAGLRSQWRDIESSTYDRVQNRAQSMFESDKAAYDDEYSRWQTANDRNVSAGNRLVDRMSKHKTNAAYSTNGSGSTYYGG